MREIHRLLLLCALSAVSFALGPSGQDPAHDVVTPDGDQYVLRVDEQDGTPLVDVLVVFEKLLETPISFQETHVQGLRVRILGELKVERGGLRHLLDRLVRTHGLVTWDSNPGEEPLIVIGMAGQQGRHGAREMSHQVIPLSDLDEVPERITALYTTVFRLSHLDARSAMSSLNPYVIGEGEHVRSVELSNAVIVSALSMERLRQMRDLIRLVDVAPSPAAEAGDMGRQIGQLEDRVRRLEAQLDEPDAGGK